MRWEGRRQSQNVEDRRQITTQAWVGGGLLSLLLMLALMFLGMDPVQVARIPGLAPQPVQRQQQGQQADDKLSQFVKVVLADNEDVWGQLFPKVFGGRYAPPTLVLFTGQVRSACGFASAAASGPSSATASTAEASRSTSTWRSTRSSAAASAPQATSRRPT